MAKFKPVKFLGTVFVTGIVLFAIISVADADSEFGVNIPPPQLTLFKADDGTEFSDFDDPKPIGSVACWMNTKLEIVNQLGITKGEEKSSFLKTNPTHVIQTNSLIDQDADVTLTKEGSKYRVTPAIKCNANEVSYDPVANNFQLGEGIDALDKESEIFSNPIGMPLTIEQPLVIHDQDLALRIYAHYPDGTIGDIYNGKIHINEKELFSTTSYDLGKIEVDPSKTTCDDPWCLRDGKYESEHKFAVEGFVLLSWKETETCSGACSATRFVIPIETEQTYNSKGQLTSVTNPLMTYRTIEVDLGAGDGTNPNQGEEDFPACPSGQTRIGDSCQVVGNQPTTQTPVNPVGGIFDSLGTCLSSGDPICLTNGQFLPLWIGGFGFVLLLGAIAQPVARQPDIYGVPYQ